MGQGPEIAGSFLHREGKGNHTAVKSLYYTTLALWCDRCHRGPPCGLGLVAAQGGLRELAWGGDAGCRARSHRSGAPWPPSPGLAPTSSQRGLEGTATGFWLFFVEGGVLQPGEGQQPLSLSRVAVSNKAQAGGDGGTKGRGTWGQTSLTWGFACAQWRGLAPQAGRGLWACRFQV